MVDPLEDNAVVYKQLTNRIAPQVAPTELIDGTSFTLDFADRKCITVGMDPMNMFKITIRITTASRYVNIPVDMLRRIFSMIGNILSIINNQPVKTRERLFLKDENITLSKMSYRGDSMLVIESHRFDGCRVLLSRDNLLTLQDLEPCINESIYQKIFIRPIILKQLDQIAEYLKNDFYLERTSTVVEIATFIKRIHDDLITENLVKNIGDIQHPSFLAQIKRFASIQLANRWMEKLNEIPSKVIIIIIYNINKLYSFFFFFN